MVSPEPVASGDPPRDDKDVCRVPTEVEEAAAAAAARRPEGGREAVGPVGAGAVENGAGVAPELEPDAGSPPPRGPEPLPPRRTGAAAETEEDDAPPSGTPPPPSAP